MQHKHNTHASAVNGKRSGIDNNHMHLMHAWMQTCACTSSLHFHDCIGVLSFSYFQFARIFSFCLLTFAVRLRCRLVMDADSIPVVIPFVHTGMQEIMPVGKKFPMVGKQVGH